MQVLRNLRSRDTHLFKSSIIPTYFRGDLPIYQNSSQEEKATDHRKIANLLYKERRPTVSDLAWVSTLITNYITNNEENEDDNNDDDM